MSAKNNSSTKIQNSHDTDQFLIIFHFRCILCKYKVHTYTKYALQTLNVLQVLNMKLQVTHTAASAVKLFHHFMEPTSSVLS